MVGLLEYIGKVIERLEEIGYVDYVVGYKPEDVASTLYNVILTLWKVGASHNYTANMIFGHTWWKLKEGINVENPPQN